MAYATTWRGYNVRQAERRAIRAQGGGVAVMNAYYGGRYYGGRTVEALEIAAEPEVPSEAPRYEEVGERECNVGNPTDAMGLAERALLEGPAAQWTEEQPQVAEGPVRLADEYNAIRDFVFAGNAYFTIVSRKTGTRYTYRVSVPKTQRGTESVHFVSLLTGPDNGNDYEFLGTVFGAAKGQAARPVYRPSRRSRIPNAPGAKAIEWVLGVLLAGGTPPVDVYHEGRCGRCGRRLTVPESITSGFGPECIGKM